jgi:hypothetical protein
MQPASLCSGRYGPLTHDGVSTRHEQYACMWGTPQQQLAVCSTALQSTPDAAGVRTYRALPVSPSCRLLLTTDLHELIQRTHHAHTACICWIPCATAALEWCRWIAPSVWRHSPDAPAATTAVHPAERSCCQVTRGNNSILSFSLMPSARLLSKPKRLLNEQPGINPCGCITVCNQTTTATTQ